MTFDIRQVDLGKLNSMTKYPSILTYHALGDKGVLQDAVQIPFEGRIIGTEKVDGTNTRLIFCPDQSVIVGSREDLLWERRDLIGNPAMGIVDAVKETVHRLVETLCRPGRIAVYFVEVFGRNIGGGAKNYTKTGKVRLPVVRRGFHRELRRDVRLARRTDRSLAGQWRSAIRRCRRDREARRRHRLSDGSGFARHGRRPSFRPAWRKPTSYLLNFHASQCKLDDDANGDPEGIVVRSPDRSRIAKLRREDYERTLRRRKKYGASMKIAVNNHIHLSEFRPSDKPAPPRISQRPGHLRPHAPHPLPVHRRLC